MVSVLLCVADRAVDPDPAYHKRIIPDFQDCRRSYDPLPSVGDLCWLSEFWGLSAQFLELQKRA